jgi:7,8-dihydropterin-6-yl-methyl-4-(beta-D-ribofuranosyl)aminobenzene 5'-phosphate synthase
MLRKITEQFKKPVYMVVGGFHTQDFTGSEIDVVIREFREMGVQKVSPAHCTGEESIQKFRMEYGSDFIQNGTGKSISL